MTKKRRCILLCLFAALALLVGGFFLVRAWLRPKVWVSLPLDDFVLTNDRGEILRSHGDDNTLKYSDVRYGIDGPSLLVPSSKTFTLETDSQKAQFAVQWDDECTFISFHGSGVLRLTISYDRITVEGEVKDFWLSAFTAEDSNRRYYLSGDEATWVRLERSENEATAESSSAYAFELRDLHTGEVFAHRDSPDGAKFTLQNPSEN